MMPPVDVILESLGRRWQTAGFAVFSSIPEISIMGVVLTVGAVFAPAGIWTAAKFVHKRRKTEGMVEEKIVDRYIQTGEVSDHVLYVGCTTICKIAKASPPRAAALST